MNYVIHFVSGKELVINAESTYPVEVSLLVAQYYGNEWYGCSIRDENGNIYCNAVREYYEQKDPNKSVYQWALEAFTTSLRIRAGLCKKYEDYDGDIVCNTDYNPFVEIIEMNVLNEVKK